MLLWDRTDTFRTTGGAMIELIEEHQPPPPTLTLEGVRQLEARSRTVQSQAERESENQTTTIDHRVVLHFFEKWHGNERHLEDAR